MSHGTWKWVAVVAFGLLSASCASGRELRRPYLIMENLDNAARCLDRGDREAGAQIYQVVLLADPLNEKARTALVDIGEHEDCFIGPSLLGKNRVANPSGRSRRLAIALYPLNRVLDILDVVSVHVGLGGGVYVDAHATRSVQVVFGAAGGTQIGWWQKHELAAGASHVAGAALGPYSAESEAYSRAGTRGAGRSSFSVVGLNRPSDLAYQRNRDYWSVGSRVTAILVGAGVEFHPLELADAVSGLFFLDFLRDDIGREKSLKFRRWEIDAMEDLLHTVPPKDLRARMRGRRTPSEDAVMMDVSEDATDNPDYSP